MNSDKDFKGMYVSLKKQFDSFLKHRRHEVKKCRYCREWYNQVLAETRKIKDKKLRDNLMEVWQTLWLNNCADFDVIANCFEVKK